MSIVDLVDDPDDERELIHALLGLSHWLDRFRKSCAEPQAVGAEELAPPAQDFVHCLLGIAALAAQLEAALCAWVRSGGAPAAPPVESARTWGLLR